MTPTARPSLVALRCLDASARHRSFTRAAAEMHLTQGAVSHQILALESQLGVALFQRQRAGLSLTAAGQAYLRDIGPALRQIERATQDLCTHRGRGGVLDVSVASSFATYWLMPRLRGFVALHPEVTINLSARIGPVDFAGSAHDAAIEYCGGALPGLQAKHVLALSLSPYAAPQLMGRRAGAPPPSRRALLKMLRTLPLIRHTTVPEAWTAWLGCAQPAIDADPAHVTAGPRYDLLSMALNGAIAGIGIALLPDYLAADAVHAGSLVRLSEAAWTSDKAYHLRFPDAKAGLPALGLFSAWLASESGRSRA